MKNPIALKDCPVGLFLSLNGELCLKTEYGDDAYIVSTGEKFWGGAKVPELIGKVNVFPLQFKFKDTDCKPVVHARWYGERGEYKCSKCGEESPNNGYYAAPYCYECGARMDLKEEDK